MQLKSLYKPIILYTRSLYKLISLKIYKPTVFLIYVCIKQERMVKQPPNSNNIIISQMIKSASKQIINLLNK